MDKIREEHWRDVAEEGENKKKIHEQRWEVYVKEKEELIKREFLVSFPYPKGGNIVWNCAKNNIIDEEEQYESIGLRGFDYKLFEEEEVEMTREGLDRYPYLNHIIQLWPGDWVEHMAKINEAVGMKNCLKMYGGGKRIVRPLRRQEFWKCIGCIISEITYGRKGYKIWSEIPKYFGRKAPTKLQRDVREYTDLYKVCCDIYCPFYTYA